MIRAMMLLLGTLAVAGCGALAAVRGDDPWSQLEAGVAAAEAQEYLQARGLLEPLFYQRPNDAVGQRALLVLVAAELDNRNPDRRLWAAADMASRMLVAGPAESWMMPVATTFYLLAMELGAAEERIAEAEAARDTAEARNLPASARESVPVRVGRITAERDQARRQAEQLQQQLAARDRELRETRAELDRIKRTIRP
jgi:hypothetical protein